MLGWRSGEGVRGRLRYPGAPEKHPDHSASLSIASGRRFVLTPPPRHGTARSHVNPAIDDRCFLFRKTCLTRNPGRATSQQSPPIMTCCFRPTGQARSPPPVARRSSHSSEGPFHALLATSLSAVHLALPDDCRRGRNARGAGGWQCPLPRRGRQVKEPGQRCYRGGCRPAGAWASRSSWAGTWTAKSFSKKLSSSTMRRARQRWPCSSYAGHGLQVDGRNYLGPVDMRLTRKAGPEPACHFA